MERREISPATLDAARRQRLWQRVDPQRAARLDQIFDSPGNLVRAQVLQEYQGVRQEDPAARLTEILDTNRNLDSRYLQYAAELQDGRTFQGLLASEMATSITLLAAQGARQELLRADLEAAQSLATSLMPEGLELDLSRLALAGGTVHRVAPAGRGADRSLAGCPGLVGDHGR